jgi:hypothetical protein
MSYLLVTAIIALGACLWAEHLRHQAASRRAIRLEAKVREQAADLTTTRAHLAALASTLERITDATAGEDLVRATSAGIADAITRVLNPLGQTTPEPDQAQVTYDSFLPWGADEPVELDDDGIIIMQGSPPGTPDDWEDVDDDRFISGGYGTFSAPEEIEP